VQDPTVESGDRPFCAQVMSALKKANIPPAPDEKTYQTFSHVVLDVKP
ncbi:cell envelope integrity protein TolA, partial [Acinetobacter baumannii]|jgi:colicin import membrane protein|nr:cell envelope integrity protein TolA [Acinetobacter baumannii]